MPEEYFASQTDKVDLQADLSMRLVDTWCCKAFNEHALNVLQNYVTSREKKRQINDKGGEDSTAAV